MPDAPYIINAEPPEETMALFQRYITDLYEERIGGAELGDVFAIGADDVLSLSLSSTGGLEKSSSALQIQVNPIGGLKTDASGAAIKLDGSSLSLSSSGLSVTGGYDGFGAATELTLDASGQIAMSGSKKFRHHSVDTYSNAASDDLSAITGGNEGELLLLSLESAARVVTVKDSASLKVGGDDFVLDDVYTRMLFVCISSGNWYAVGSCLDKTGAETISGAWSFSTHVKRAVSAGITASTTQSQGQQILTADINEISTCANAGDVVTMPTAAAGLVIRIINNGANSCDVYPSSGDNLGAGVDTAVALAAGSNITYVCYDATNWETM